jgi:hypothetical protein
MLYRTCWRKRNSSEVGSLMSYWTNWRRGVSCGQSIGMGNGRSEWERVTMKGKSFW